MVCLLGAVVILWGVYVFLKWDLALIVTRWAPEVQNIFYRGSKRQLVPSNQDKLEHFFNCAATLMTKHLQTIALESMADFIDLLIQPPVNVWCLWSHCAPSRQFSFSLQIDDAALVKFSDHFSHICTLLSHFLWLSFTSFCRRSCSCVVKRSLSDANIWLSF